MRIIDQWMKKHRTKLSGALAIVFLVFSKPSSLTLFYGVIPVLIGESIRIWASGYIHKNQELTTTGPYSLSRNPLYVGSFIIGTGFIIAMGVFWLAMIFMVFFALVYWFTIRWEESKLERLFPDQWPEYWRGVPRFIPVLQWPGYNPGEFSWSQVTKHKETLNASVVLAVYAILWAKALWMGNG